MYNHIVLVGRMTADPELKYTPQGIAVTNFRIAVDRQFTNKQGERETDFIDIVAWRQAAEFCCNYLGKGRMVLVDGRLQIRDWQTKEGEKRRTAEVQAINVKGLDRPKGDRPEAQPAAARAAAEPSAPAGGGGGGSEPEPDWPDPFQD